MKTILFQGDSITDCGWDRKAPTVISNLGAGYARLVSAELGYENPGEYTFYNRGVSGNRIVDLYARIKADFINLAPDYASIYVGVNDTWHEIAAQNGVDTEKFEKIYTMYIDEIKAACPNIKLIIIAPYVLEGNAIKLLLIILWFKGCKRREQRSYLMPQPLCKCISVSRRSCSLI